MALPNIKIFFAVVLIAVVLTTGIVLLTGTDRTEAAIDMTGTWNVNLRDNSAVKLDNCIDIITQTGSALSVTVLCSLFGSGSLTGSITKATGDFVGLSGTVGGDPVSFSGTTDGSSASGTWSSTSLSGTFTATKKSASFTFNVDSTVDVVDANIGNGICATGGGACTLRAAIQEANALGPVVTINVPAGTYALTITGNSEDSAATGDLDITRDLVIKGAGANTTIVTQSTNDRVFEVLDVLGEIKVGILGLTIQGGAPPAGQGGAGIRNFANLGLLDSTIRDNTAIAGGGGMFQFGATATIFSTTFSNNATGTLGGGIESSSSTLTIVNSTMSGNTADLGGGALDQVGVTSDVTLINATITGNIADADDNGSGGGGGVALSSGASTVRNTIIAGNISLNNDFAPNCAGTWTSTGYNLIGHDTNCTFLATSGDQVGTLAVPIDPLLGPLTDNGGPTLTHAIHGASPATDAGNPATPGSGGDACEPVDQRKVVRPKDGDLNTAAICDIGAFEAPQAPTGGDRLVLSFDGNLTVTVPALSLVGAPCPVKAVLDAPLGPVVTNGMGKEERTFTIDFLSGWASCPGPLSLGSSITSGGLIVEQVDTTPGLDFPADMTVTLCLKIDTLEFTGLGELQNCPDGFSVGQKRPIILNCTLFSFTSFTCTIDTGAGAPEFFNDLATPVAEVNSGVISLTEIQPAVGGIAQPPDELIGVPLESPGSSGNGVGSSIAVGLAIAAGAAVLGGVMWYARKRRLP